MGFDFESVTLVWTRAAVYTMQTDSTKCPDPKSWDILINNLAL